MWFSPSEIVFVIEVNDFFLGFVDPECDPPVSGGGQAPRSLTVAGESRF
jgi:hypothetical protein